MSLPAAIKRAFTLRELAAGRYILQHPSDRRVIFVLHYEQLLEDLITVHGGLLGVFLAAGFIQTRADAVRRIGEQT